MFLLSFRKPDPGETWAEKGKIPADSKELLTAEEESEG